jgi:hypothetical protein
VPSTGASRRGYASNDSHPPTAAAIASAASTAVAAANARSWRDHGRERRAGLADPP